MKQNIVKMIELQQGSSIVLENEKIDILFLGSFFPSEKRAELYKNTRGVLQFGGDVYQRALLKGLSELNNINLTVMTSITIGSFPFRHKKIYVKNDLCKNDNYDISFVGFINLTMYKILSRYISCKRYIIKWVNNRKNSKNKKILIISSLDYSLLKSSCDIKRKYNVQLCLILPDLIRYMVPPKSFIYKLAMPYFEKKNMQLMYYIDFFILISKLMLEKIGIKSKPYVVIEGIYDETESNSIAIKENKNVIMYSGMIAKQFGLLHLLNAFNLLTNKNIQLWICGEGDAKNDILEAVNNNKNIKYFGQIDRKIVLDMQQRATLLINPRLSSDEYTFYSFSSKTIEYMASGTPVLMHKLKGIPNEYHPYIYFCEDESDMGLRDKIIELCDRPRTEMEKFGKQAKEFIKKNKTSAVQAEKILRMFMNEK